MRRVWILAAGTVSAALDGSGFAVDARLGKRLVAKAQVTLPVGEPRLHGLARLAAEQALQGLDLSAVDAESAGVFVSASKGGMQVFDGSHPDVGPWLWRYLASGPGEALRDHMGWRGGGGNYPLACATGSYSIGAAFDAVAEGRLELALAGAAEASLTPLMLAAFDNLGALSKAANPVEYRGPFEQGRSGLILAEGAGVLFLASDAAAQRLRAAPLARIVSWASNSDAYHITNPDPSGQGGAKAIARALAKAGWKPDDVDYLNAHGTGTRSGDAAEAKVLELAFGPEGPWVSGLKGKIGHTLGAAGAIEAAHCALALRQQVLPGHGPLHDPMPEMARRLLGADLAGKVEKVLSLSLGFGGHNVVLAMERA